MFNWIETFFAAAISIALMLGNVSIAINNDNTPDQVAVIPQTASLVADKESGDDDEGDDDDDIDTPTTTDNDGIDTPTPTDNDGTDSDGIDTPTPTDNDDSDGADDSDDSADS